MEKCSRIFYRIRYTAYICVTILSVRKMRYYDEYVKDEKYVNDTVFTHFAEHFNEISGKTWGIIGLGTIGRRVADIAKAFGAHVVYYSASGRAAQEGYEQVDFETLLSTSDIVSVHAPLNEYTKKLNESGSICKNEKDSYFLKSWKRTDCSRTGFI